MARPALTDAQRRETRRKIRQAAAKLYTENGASNVSARAVAEAAGVSVGTLYSYYSNLSELLQSLWRQPTRRLINELEQLAQATPEPAARLRSLLTSYVRFAFEERSLFKNAFLFVRPESVKPPAKINLQVDRFFQLFRQAICDGQQVGVFRQGAVDELTQIIIGSVHGAIALPINLHRLNLEASDQIALKTIDVQLEWLQSHTE